MDNQKFFLRYDELRNKKGLTHADVARDIGINPIVFTDWKSGKSAPKADKLLKIARYFNVPVEHFIED